MELESTLIIEQFYKDLQRNNLLQNANILHLIIMSFYKVILHIFTKVEVESL